MTSEPDPRVFFAAERTFLAWIRTGLALMGFGFVVARFGLFLREIAAMQGGPPPPAGLSRWFGIGLIALGVLLTAWRVPRPMPVAIALTGLYWTVQRIGG